jgi:uncharacterized membrane protein
MEPALVVALLWLFFGGTHVVLGIAPIRAPLVRRFGELGFVVLFSLVALATLGAVVTYFSAYRNAGPPGLALATHPVARPLLIATIVVGIALAAAGLAGYPRSAMVLFARRVHGPTGIARVTRHPFFAGTFLVMTAHAVLATRLIGAVFCAGFAALSFFGALLQDKKLRARLGEPYATVLAETSFLPFAAVIQGRQSLALSDLPWRAFLGGAIAALAIRLVHDRIFSAGGAWLLAVVAGGAVAVTLPRFLKTRRGRTPS